MIGTATHFVRSVAGAPGELIRLAAIDVGSNSIHMVVAQAEPDGSITTLWRAKEMVGLGRSSFPAHRIPAAVADRAIDSLRRMVQSARRRQCDKILACATSAVREAENGGDFIERVRRELGLSLRVISARDEARLIYVGVRSTVDLSAGPHLIIDIGGGSAEFIVADDQRPLLLESRKLGAARMTAQFIHSDPVSAKELKRLLGHYDVELGGLCEQIRAAKPIGVIGCSGTLETLSAMCGTGGTGNGDGSRGVIERQRLARVVAQLLESRDKDRAQMRGLDSHRQDQIIAGAVLANELMRLMNIKEIHMAQSALREGIVADYVSRHLGELVIGKQVQDPRRRSVLDLARRCDWHQAHAEHVAKLCLMLFDQLRPLHRLNKRQRELVEYGALLHDIGWHIASSKHHRHSMYLILNGNLKGFTPEEVRIIANIARYHRKARPKDSHGEYTALSRPSQRVVQIGAALLRVADGLDRSHCRVISDLRCRIHGRRIEVMLSGKGEVELDMWGARRKMDWLASLFDRSIRLERR